MFRDIEANNERVCAILCGKKAYQKIIDMAEVERGLDISEEKKIQFRKKYVKYNFRFKKK